MITKFHKRHLKKTAPKEKKRRLREDFIIVRTPADNDKGYKDEWVYSGPLMAWKSEDDTKRIRIIVLLTTLQLILTLVGSLRWFSPNWFIVVTLLKLLSMIPLLFELIGVVRLFSARGNMPKRDYNSINASLRIAPWITAGMLAATLAAQIWAMTQYFDLAAVAVSVMTAASAVLAAFVSVVYCNMEAVPVKNTAKAGLKELNDKATGRATGIYVPKRRNKQ